MRNPLVFLFLCVLSQGAFSQATPLTHHPLITGYDNAPVWKKTVNEFDEYNAFTGMDADGNEPTSLTLEGKITKVIYKTLRERSTLEIFRNYEEAVVQAGGEIIFSCNQDKQECAARYAGPTMAKFGVTAILNTAGRYLLGKIEQGEDVAYLAIAVGQVTNEIHVVEVKDIDLGMVMLDADALGKGLDAKGYVVVEGIFFDTDKATLKPESTDALQEVAKLLESRADLNVYVVGHTDAQGTFEYNRTLSNQRAAAVANELTESYGISRERMDAHGVGPLSPQATNASEVGRAKNRRVVLVVQ